MTVYGVGVGVSEAIRKAASAKVQRVTHSYYDGTLTAYTPAIDHMGRTRTVASAVAFVLNRAFEK